MDCFKNNEKCKNGQNKFEKFSFKIPQQRDSNTQPLKIAPKQPAVPGSNPRHTVNASSILYYMCHCVEERSKLNKEEARNVEVTETVISCERERETHLQCDQMARLFANIWSLTQMKICPIAKIGSNLCPMLNEGFENSQRLSKCGQRGEFLPNLVTLRHLPQHELNAISRIDVGVATFSFTLKNDLIIFRGNNKFNIKRTLTLGVI